MKITRDNYEVYVLDYLEGNLSGRKAVAFEEFLNSHPEIMEEICGVDQFILIPDTETIYPDKSGLYRKESAAVLPFWNIRTVAAAVAILLVSTATFFIWKSSINQSTIQPEDNQITITNPEVNLPATRMPMPEAMPDLKQDTQEESEHEWTGGTEVPEPGVMALQEKRSVQSKKVHFNDPALTSDVAANHINLPVQQNVINVIDDSLKPLPIPNGSEFPYRFEIDGVVTPLPESVISGIDRLLPPVPIPNSSDQHGSEIAVLDLKINYSSEDRNNTVAYLPIKQHEITIQQGLPATFARTVSPKAASQTYIIHIPGEFLSETWTDVSVANFKKKLIPQFIKSQLNL